MLSIPSISLTLTATCSLKAVGIFFPTKSALIGNSRCPRSTKTATAIDFGRPVAIKASIAARIVLPV